tara:strand:- start:88 stop:369 length:282 start_codon:yes stop_codon:yes gene_type:complete
MAFSSAGFVNYGGGKKGVAPSLYGYSTTDAIGDVNTEGYFNSLADVLAVGDTILVRSSTGGTQALSWVYVLTITAAGVVDVTDGLTITATDSD